jgi:hypothetical protein
VICFLQGSTFKIIQRFRLFYATQIGDRSCILKVFLKERPRPETGKGGTDWEFSVGPTLVPPD